jgi:hypothetical protein
VEKTGILTNTETIYKKKLGECDREQDKGTKGINDTILSGDVAIKVLRIATGKNLGPGVYRTDKSTMEKKSSHNIKSNKQYQDLNKIAKLKPSVSKMKASQLMSTFFQSERQTLSKIFHGDEESKKRLVSPRGSSKFNITSRSSLSSNQPENQRYNITQAEAESQICNQTNTTINESKEIGLQKLIEDKDTFSEQVPINHENSISPNTREMIRNVATPEFQNIQEVPETVV